MRHLYAHQEEERSSIKTSSREKGTSSLEKDNAKASLLSGLAAPLVIDSIPLPLSEVYEEEEEEHENYPLKEQPSQVIASKSMDKVSSGAYPTTTATPPVDESLGTVSARQTLRAKLLEIDARLTTILDSMHKTRRKINMIAFKTEFNDSPDDTEETESLSEDEAFRDD